MPNRGIQITLALLMNLVMIPFRVSSQGNNYQISESVFRLLDPVYGVDQRLISGSYYYGPRKGSITGNAYFIDETWKRGSVTIDNLTFNNLNLKYDVENNQIVLMFADIKGSALKISLKKENIDKFTMNGRLFIPYPGTQRFDTARFCEVAASGEINYLILKTKEVELSHGGSTDFIYMERIKQFLLINGQLIPFRLHSTLYKLYPEHKQELRRYLRSQALYPFKNKISDRVEMVNYCNQLITRQH